MKEAKIIKFKGSDDINAERRYRHLSDYLFTNPCNNCKDADTDFCLEECKSKKVVSSKKYLEKKFIENILNNSKSF